MGDRTDPSGSAEHHYLQTVQYRDASNLNRRGQLHDRFSVNKHGFHQWVFDHFVQTPGNCILEVGCGSGQLWLRNAERVPTDWTVVLSDFSTGMLRDARTTLGDHAQRVVFTAADAQCIPFQDDTFDVVVANHMLYLVRDSCAVLSEIRRVLKSTGQLYASANGLRHLRELGDLVRRYEPEYRGDTGGAGKFGLENGRDQLLGYFNTVDLFRYDDALVITDPEALVHWAESWAHGAFSAERLPELFAFLAKEGAKGDIRVSKDSGLFVARNSQA